MMLIKCTKCNIEKEDTDFYWRKDGKINGYTCKKCHITVMEKYRRTAKGKAVQKKADKKHAGTAKRKASNKKYAGTEKSKAVKKKHRGTEKGKASMARANANRYDKKRDEIDTLTKKQWLQILKDQEHKCNGCRISFSEEKPATEDHIIPLGEGPGRIKENMQALCLSCNSIKGTKDMKHLLESLEDLKQNTETL